MKNTLIYILLATFGGLLLTSTTAQKESPPQKYDYLFIEQYPSFWQFYENEKLLYSITTDRQFRNRFRYDGHQNYIMIQIDSLSNEKWELMQLQSNYNSDYSTYLYSAILKRKKSSSSE